MKHFSGESLPISNPRLLAAVYFAFLAIILTILISTVLYVFGFEQSIYIFKAVLLGGLVAAVFGALFGRRIIHCKRPYRYKAFILGFIMTLAAVPFYDLGLLYLIKDQPQNAFNEVNYEQMMLMYLFVVMESYILAGLWLAFVTGLAAVYLRSHLIYRILHMENYPYRSKRKLRNKSYRHKLRAHHH